ncbi:hypothetical protein [Desulfobacter curvatus]|uniref:hypothetical protein n=1 Tax=Desulfobacter curvatus TaxID=2290 RepID=UPI0003730DD2|nr:hypothetical protein [Desulfobacter curvatus]
MSIMSKKRIKMLKKQSLKNKRNEKNILALIRQQKECWGGGLQRSVKKPDKAVQEAVQQRLKR